LVPLGFFSFYTELHKGKGKVTQERSKHMTTRQVRDERVYDPQMSSLGYPAIRIAAQALILVVTPITC
jgi:hypothetical protein